MFMVLHRIASKSANFEYHHSCLLLEVIYSIFHTKNYEYTFVTIPGLDWELHML